MLKTTIKQKKAFFGRLKDEIREMFPQYSFSSVEGPNLCQLTMEIVKGEEPEDREYKEVFRVDVFEDLSFKQLSNRQEDTLKTVQLLAEKYPRCLEDKRL